MEGGVTFWHNVLFQQMHTHTHQAGIVSLNIDSDLTLPGPMENRELQLLSEFTSAFSCMKIVCSVCLNGGVPFVVFGLVVRGGPLGPKGLLANFWGSGAHVLTMDTLRACADSFDGSDTSAHIGIKFRHSMECQCG